MPAHRRRAGRSRKHSCSRLAPLQGARRAGAGAAHASVVFDCRHCGQEGNSATAVGLIDSHRWEIRNQSVSISDTPNNTRPRALGRPAQETTELWANSGLNLSFVSRRRTQSQVLARPGSRKALSKSTRDSVCVQGWQHEAQDARRLSPQQHQSQTARNTGAKSDLTTERHREGRSFEGWEGKGWKGVSQGKAGQRQAGRDRTSEGGGESWRWIISPHKLP